MLWKLATTESFSVVIFVESVEELRKFFDGKTHESFQFNGYFLLIAEHNAKVEIVYDLIGCEGSSSTM